MREHRDRKSPVIFPHTIHCRSSYGIRTDVVSVFKPRDTYDSTLFTGKTQINLPIQCSPDHSKPVTICDYIYIRYMMFHGMVACWLDGRAIHFFISENQIWGLWYMTLIRSTRGMKPTERNLSAVNKRAPTGSCQPQSCCFFVLKPTSRTTYQVYTKCAWDFAFNVRP